MDEIKSERFKAVVTLIVTTAVTIVNMYGFTIDVDTWVNCCLCILNAVCIGYTWWKNQNITEEAVKGQHLINQLKAERKNKE